MWLPNVVLDYQPLIIPLEVCDVTFGTEIRRLRAERKLSLRELATRVGIDFSYLSKIENDRGLPPSEETIRRLAKELDADAEVLILQAGKLPQAFEEDLLSRPQKQVAGLYRVLLDRTFSDEQWEKVLNQLGRSGKTS
jgi:HTH-type transcriptional regulator, competence development regulator